MMGRGEQVTSWGPGAPGLMEKQAESLRPVSTVACGQYQKGQAGEKRGTYFQMERGEPPEAKGLLLGDCVLWVKQGDG